MIQISQGVKGMSELDLYINSLAAGTATFISTWAGGVGLLQPCILYIERDRGLSTRGRDENDTADTPNLSMKTKIEMV